MLRKRVDELFADYADAYAKGERPRSEAYLERAGEDAGELATLIERFLQAAPRRAATPEDARTAERWAAGAAADPPLLMLRRKLGLKRDEVVDRLMKELKIDATKREKVAGYYHELETGLLEPEGVRRKVYDALSRIFDRPVPAAGGARYALARRVEPAYFRALDALPHVDVAASAPVEAERDEVDDLFTGGTDQPSK